MNNQIEILRKLEDLYASSENKIKDCKTTKEVEEVRIYYLGKKGVLTSQFLKELGNLPSDIRPIVGQRTNEIKQGMQAFLQQKQEELKESEEKNLEKDLFVDVTLPGSIREIGFCHLLMQTQKELEEIFISLGYSVEEGPEIENVFYNFEALNTPEWHPARDENDSFYLVQDQILLRTHTSPVQIRTMEKTNPPLAIIAPGKVYRSDYDATHLPVFNQLEGLLVGKGINVTHLKGTLEYFVSKIFGVRKKIRLRPSFFPFTEPSFEVDVSWEDRYGKTQWLEILGAGMVDPNVFRSVGYDSEEWTGFAFGVGIERIAMLKYNLSDIRDLIRGDIRFLRQDF